MNVFGFAAVATLVGLFSEEAMSMLKSVASTVFTEPEPAADPAVRIQISRLWTKARPESADNRQASPRSAIWRSASGVFASSSMPSLRLTPSVRSNWMSP